MKNAVVISTKLTKLLGCTHPLMNAPMTGMTKGALAGEVARAGGIGLVSVGYEKIFGSDWLDHEFQIAKDLAAQSAEGITGALGIAFLPMFMNEDDQSFSKALDLKPDFVFLSFGNPTMQLSQCKARGIKVAVQVSTMSDARDAFQLGADVIILQGCDSGGHGMQHQGTSVFTLVPQARKEFGVDACIMAAGGIGSGSGVAAALTLGSDGILLGTRYLNTKECAAQESFKARISSTIDATEGTIISQSYDQLTNPMVAFPDPWSGRVLRRGTVDFSTDPADDNETIKKFHVPIDTPPDLRPSVTPEDKLWYKQGGYNVRAVWCGAGAGLHAGLQEESAFDVTVSTIMDARDIIRHPPRTTLL